MHIQMTDTLIGYALSNIRNQFSTNNELGVEISPSLVELKELRYLDLSMNSFGGIKVPEFIGRLTELRYLSLSGASFSGSVTSFLGNLLNLQVLDLSFYSEKPAENDLEWLRGLSFLEHLSFGGLDLSKVADSWLHTVNSHSPSLPELDLPECQLLDLPSSLPSLSLLFWYSIFPTMLSTRVLSLNGFSNSVTFVHLDLKTPTNIVSELPDEFAKLTSLEYLDVSSNYGIKVFNTAGISDVLPDWFVDMAYNNLSGNVPDKFKFDFLANVDLISNRFQGPLPLWSSNITSLYLRDNLFSGPIPVNICEALPNLTLALVLRCPVNFVPIMNKKTPLDK
ncbi:hypothetical protein BC332_18021 [Capsicum chinense]|nr:hypothetical protein BC332_18021 [Capsicum chinense]